MDYRVLLKKYIRHVGEREGVSFLGLYSKSNFFNDSEWEEMRKIDNEVDEEIKKDRFDN